MAAALASQTSGHRSWASIVAGPRSPQEDTTSAAAAAKAATVAAPSPRRPGAKGSLQCVCRGKMLVMLGYYGWILPLDEIDHPDANKNGGRIYVRKRDFRRGAAPIEGDVVEFYLYVDDQGLGAESCRLESRSSRRRGGTSGAGGTFAFSVEAAEFVPGCSAGGCDDDLAAPCWPPAVDDSAAAGWSRWAVDATDDLHAGGWPRGAGDPGDSQPGAGSPSAGWPLAAPPGLDAPLGLPSRRPGLPLPKASSRDSSQDGSTSAGASSDAGPGASSRSTSPVPEGAVAAKLPPWRRGEYRLSAAARAAVAASL